MARLCGMQAHRFLLRSSGADVASMTAERAGVVVGALCYLNMAVEWGAQGLPAAVPATEVFSVAAQVCLCVRPWCAGCMAMDSVPPPPLPTSPLMQVRVPVLRWLHEVASVEDRASFLATLEKTAVISEASSCDSPPHP